MGVNKYRKESRLSGTAAGERPFLGIGDPRPSPEPGYIKTQGQLPKPRCVEFVRGPLTSATQTNRQDLKIVFQVPQYICNLVQLNVMKRFVNRRQIISFQTDRHRVTGFSPRASLRFRVHNPRESLLASRTYPRPR